MKLLFFCALVSIYLYQTDAFINVNFHPDDLGRVNDFVETIIFNNQHQALLQSPARTNIPIGRKIIFGTIQLFGVMITIVSSNLLTAKLEPFVTPLKQQPEVIVIVKSLPPVQCQCHCPHHHQQHEQQQQQQQLQLQQQQFEELLLGSYTNGVKDYGCNKNVCWRACFSENHNEKIPWCYSSPKSIDRNYHKCVSGSDCSPFWECLEECHL